MIAVPKYLEELLSASDRRKGLAGFSFALFVGCGRQTAGLLPAMEDRDLPGVGTHGPDSGLTQAERLQPDLIVIGGDLDGREPFGFIAEMARTAPGAVVLFLAARADTTIAGRALDAGAYDIVAPPHSLASILLRGLVAARRTASPQPRALRRQTVAGLEIDVEARRVWDGETPVNLSGREFELLMRLLESEGEVVARETLMDDIWGRVEGSEAVLDATVHRLRRKLEHSMRTAVTTVRGVGYRLESLYARS